MIYLIIDEMRCDAMWCDDLKGGCDIDNFILGGSSIL